MAGYYGAYDLSTLFLCVSQDEEDALSLHKKLSAHPDNTFTTSYAHECSGSEDVVISKFSIMLRGHCVLWTQFASPERIRFYKNIAKEFNAKFELVISGVKGSQVVEDFHNAK